MGHAMPRAQRFIAECTALVGKRVLVVENQSLVALDLETVLAEAGCIVVGPCATAAEALCLIEREKIDCATLNLTLVSRHDPSIADALAARSIPFIFVTGHLHDRIPERHRGRLVEDKPYLCTELTAKLSRAVVVGR